MVWHNGRLYLCSTWALDLSTALEMTGGSAWEDGRKCLGGQEQALEKTGGSAWEDGYVNLKGRIYKFALEAD